MPSRTRICWCSIGPRTNGRSRIPGAAAAYRAGLERKAVAADQRIVNALSTSAEERYEAFVKKYPSIVQRVPQFMLASYLGVTPETLSRVRKSRSRT